MQAFLHISQHIFLRTKCSVGSWSQCNTGPSHASSGSRGEAVELMCASGEADAGVQGAAEEQGHAQAESITCALYMMNEAHG